MSSFSKLDNTLLDMTKKAFEAIPKEMIDTMPEDKREEFMYDLGEAIESAVRDHFSISVEEYLAATAP
jgi:PBP1b-binding outer membrane lipoprotein LpoB